MALVLATTKSIYEFYTRTNSTEHCKHQNIVYEEWNAILLAVLFYL